MPWYFLHTVSGYEDKVVKTIMFMIEQGKLESVDKAIIPKEKRVESKSGKRKTVERKMFPGYVMVKITSLTNENRIALRQLQGVLNFIGSADNPQALTEDEVNNILSRIDKEAPELDTSYSIGDTVKILSGTFEGLLGKVREIEHERRKVQIMVHIFGRETPVELDFDQVEIFGETKPTER